MKFYLLIVSVVMMLMKVVTARPEGYVYPQPSGPDYSQISTNFVGDSSSSQFITATGSGSGSSSSSSSFSGSSAGIGYQQPTIVKHIYVHVPPTEEEQHYPTQQFPIQPAQKHYKIIFIKTPTAPAYQAPIIPVQPQNEEKTLIYVLVKRPNAQPDIVIPTATPTEPSKPEVYFIKYNTQKESHGSTAVNSGGSSSGSGSGSGSASGSASGSGIAGGSIITSGSSSGQFVASGSSGSSSSGQSIGTPAPVYGPAH